jgi:hypothetical protein
MKLPFGAEITFGKKRQQMPTMTAVINAAVNDILRQWEISDDRKSIYDDVDRMIRSDEYVAEALDVLTGDCLPVKNFYDPILDIECEDEGLKKKVEAILKQSRIESQLKNIIYTKLKYNNAHGEFIVYANKKFSHLQLIPQTWSVYRNIDNHGQLLAGDPTSRKINYCAYDQRSDAGDFLIGFYQYQIIHWRGSPQDASGNGIPFLEAARKNWLRLQVLEDSMAIARVVRAYMKLIHYVPVGNRLTDEQMAKAIKDYKDSILEQEITTISNSVLQRNKVSYPTSVSSDIFVPQSETLKGDVKSIDPSNPQLQNLADMKYALNRLFARLKVPKARLANEEDVRAKATMYEINSAYAGTIAGEQIDILQGILDMVNRALFLDGIDIERAEFKLILPSPFVKNDRERAEIEKYEAETVAQYIKSNVMSRDMARQKYLGMDEKESEAEAEKVTAEKDIFPSSGGIGMFASKAIPDDMVLKELWQLKSALGGDGRKDRHIHDRF